MNKKQIRLTEGNLKQIVRESVNKSLKEDLDASHFKSKRLSQYLRNNPDAFFDVLNRSTEMPKGYDDEYMPSQKDATKIARINKEGEPFSYMKDIENNASWDAFDADKMKRYNESKNMNRKLIRLTESDLHRIVKESIERILKENDGSYRGVYIQGLGLPEKVAMSKVDACFEKGWPVDKIQRAIDAWGYEQREDYKYKY